MCYLPFLALILTKHTLFKSLMENQDSIFRWLPAVGHRHRADPFEQRGGAASSLYPCQDPGTEKKNSFQTEFNACPRIPKQMKYMICSTTSLDTDTTPILSILWEPSTHLSVLEVAGHILYLLHQCAEGDKPNSNFKTAAAVRVWWLDVCLTAVCTCVQQTTGNTGLSPQGEDWWEQDWTASSALREEC